MNIADVLLESFSTRNAKSLRKLLQSNLGANEYHCYLHPLGFYFVRLVAHNETTLRLHYWPARERELGTASTGYHDHIWKLRSCVLVGAIENVLLDVVEDESGAFQIAEINQANGIDEAIPKGPALAVKIRSRQIITAGEFYELEPRVFHFTEVLPNQAAITLVRADVIIKGAPRTLVPVGCGERARPREVAPDSDQLLLEIAELLEKSA